MRTQLDPKNTVIASPSKALFVGMLTRDIDLIDAILDLVDNCMDGVLRTLSKSPKRDGDQPYKGFKVAIDLSPKKFSITDNCGGIPRDVALKYAFRMGRPDPNLDKDLATVGMYGIGMKRALFKIGRSSSVASRHKDSSFKVTISSDWLDDDENWLLPITDLHGASVPDELKEGHGTRIEIKNLYPGISKAFSQQNSDFIDQLYHTVATHYSYIIYKGLAIEVNGDLVRPRPIMLLASETWGDNEISPYLYRVEHDGVEVALMVGLYAEPPDENDIEAELEGRSETKPLSGKREYAGWTIICNDRVVVYNDKSILTGWGEAGVPGFHSQFRSVSGIVHFRTTQPLKLPVNTTKRGLDAQSSLYLGVKEFMREGLKVFTGFTNTWKSPSEERNGHFQRTQPIDAIKAASTFKPPSMKTVRKGLGGEKFVPSLPKPAGVVAVKYIRFPRNVEDISDVAEYLFKDSDVPPSQVGERCFDIQLDRARRQ